MAQIENREVLKRIETDAFISTARGKVQDQLSTTVVPVIVSNPYRVTNLSKSATRNASGGATIFTSDSVKETYLTSFTFSFIADVACNAGTGDVQINCRVNGATVELITLPFLTTTVQSQALTVNLKEPLLIDKGSNVDIANLIYAAGNCVRTANIHGFTVDPQ